MKNYFEPELIVVKFMTTDLMVGSGLIPNDNPDETPIIPADM